MPKSIEKLRSTVYSLNRKKKIVRSSNFYDVCKSQVHRILKSCPPTVTRITLGCTFTL